MEISLIEKFDKLKYNLLKWFTFGWIVCYGTFTLKDFLSDHFMIIILTLVGLVGWIFWSVNLIKILRLQKKIKNDLKLINALYNELHQYYQLKSFFWGFCVCLFTIIIFMAVGFFYQVTALIVCKVILINGLSSVLIANLVYNKG